MPRPALPARLPARLPVAVPAVLAACLLLGACTGGEQDPPQAFPTPPASSFAPGTCELVAEDVLALGRAARDLGDGPRVEAPTRTALEQAQKALQEVAETAEPELKPLLDAVVTRAGLVRIAADAERYEPEVSEPLAESYDDLVEACTGDGPPAAATATATTG